MSAITNDWLAVLQPEFSKPYYRELYETVKKEYRDYRVYPDSGDLFNAFHLTPLNNVKVVIIGQDPYHNAGQAHGLCFSVKKDYRGKDALILKDLENGGIVFDAETGWYRIRILPEDTEKLDFGKYFFDIRKKDDTGEKYLCPMTELEICPVVTHRENMR